MAYFFQRLALSIPKIFVLLFACFILVEFAPSRGGEIPSQESPFLVRMFEYFWNVFTRFDFGMTVAEANTSVADKIFSGLEATLVQGALASGLMLLLGIPLGVFAAIERSTWLDRLVSFLALFAQIVPNFILAPALVFFFTLTLNAADAHGGNSENFSILLLPTLTLGIAFLADVARMTRASMIEVMSASYIKGARAKGLSMREVVIHHALMPALLPVWSHLAPIFVYLLTGTVFVDVFFDTGGLGISLSHSALNNDYSLMMGLAFVYGLLTIGANIIIDMVYVVVDPKLKGTLV